MIEIFFSRIIKKVDGNDQYIQDHTIFIVVEVDSDLFWQNYDKIDQEPIIITSNKKKSST